MGRIGCLVKQAGVCVRVAPSHLLHPAQASQRAGLPEGMGLAAFACGCTQPISVWLTHIPLGQGDQYGNRKEKGKADSIRREGGEGCNSFPDLLTNHLSKHHLSGY